MSVSESMKEHALPQQYTVGTMANTETHQYTLWNCILQSRGVLGHLPRIGWHHQWLIYVTGVRVMRKTQKSPSIHHYNPYNWDSWPLCLLWLALYFFLCLDGWLVLFFFVFFFQLLYRAHTSFQWAPKNCLLSELYSLISSPFCFLYPYTGSHLTAGLCVGPGKTE